MSTALAFVFLTENSPLVSCTRLIHFLACAPEGSEGLFCELSLPRFEQTKGTHQAQNSTQVQFVEPVSSLGLFGGVWAEELLPKRQLQGQRDALACRKACHRV